MKNLLSILFLFTMLTGVAQETEEYLTITMKNGKEFALEKNKKHSFFIRDYRRFAFEIDALNYVIIDSNRVQLSYKTNRINEKGNHLIHMADTIVYISQIERIRTVKNNKKMQIIGGTLFGAGVVLTTIAIIDQNQSQGGVISDNILGPGIGMIVSGAIIFINTIRRRTYILRDGKNYLNIVEIKLKNEN